MVKEILARNDSIFVIAIGREFMVWKFRPATGRPRREWLATVRNLLPTIFASSDFATSFLIKLLFVNLLIVIREKAILQKYSRKVRHISIKYHFCKFY